MKIRAPKEIIVNILDAIDNGKMSNNVNHNYTIDYTLDKEPTYIEFIAKDGKDTQLSNADWTVLSSFVIN